MNIDWSKAPEAATHYLSTDKNPWRMVHEDGSRFAYLKGEWVPVVNHVPFDEYIPRPPYNGGQVDACTSFPMGEVTIDYVVPTGPTWNGKGLPPVGAVCEAQVKNGGQWRKYTIRAVSDEYLIVWSNADALETPIRHVYWEFRPIRTPEQIAAEERERAVMEIYERANKQGGSVLSMLMEAYDAGCLKVNS
ncbi:hypothetical protein [Pseudomonas sp.]|uniref:hypothetical protein n=1 Tax=Pseudomonas sp. TaxID=306 RepID=UPI00289C668B|nr:hypothetical protein [Pseudomonas sp.]